MPPPDWERDDVFRPQADQPGADRGLAHRLSRLPTSHPSAWRAPDRAGEDYRDQRREEWWHPAADGEHDDGGWEPADVAGEPDECAGDADEFSGDPGDAPTDDDADPEDPAGAPGDAGGRPPVRGERWPQASPRRGELGGWSARSPYRPWFSADGAADPWFVVRETE
jgi:hypothetical protein